MGQTLKAGGTRFRINSLHLDDVELAHCETGQVKQIKKGTLLAQIGVHVEVEDDGKSLIPPNATELERAAVAKVPLYMQSAATNRDLISKLRWIVALKEMGYDSRSAEEDIDQAMISLEKQIPADFKRFTSRTIKEKMIRLREAGDDPRVLTPMFSSRGGGGQPRVNTIAETLLQKRIEQERKRAGQLRPIDVLGGHIDDVQAWNREQGNAQIEPLSESTVRRRFQAAYDAFYIAVRNKGRKAAERQFRSAGVRWKAQDPLLASQFDDTDGEVYLIDERTGMPWGRANITMGIDEHTRSILGREISETPRDAWAAISAFVNAILPKDMSAKEFELCEKPWYAYGKLGEAQMDNALWYRSAALIDGAIIDAGTIPAWSKPYTPTGKSQIEHLNDIFKSDFTPDLPGWRGPKREKDGLKLGPGTAVMGLHEYVQLANKWMTDRYPYMPQEDGLCPWDRWSRFFKGREPAMPRDTQRYRLIATVRESFRFRDSGGLLRMGLRYQSKELDQLREAIGSNEQVQTRIHPRDLSCIYVFHPRLKVFIKVPCAEQDAEGYLVGLTHYQQKLILKYCRENKKKNPSLKDCVAAKEAIKKIADELRASKKVSERRKGFRQRGDIENSPIDAPEAPDQVASPAQKRREKFLKEEEPSLMSELERQMLELEEVDLSDNEEGYQDAVPA